jgi:hypothetical protein
MWREHTRQGKIYKKFLEELIACFLLIRHVPHRKRHLQQFFVAARTSLPSCYLATIGGYTDPQAQPPTILLLLLVFIDAGTCLPSGCLAMKGGITLPSLCLTMIGEIYIETHRLMGGIHEVRRWDGLRCYDIHTKFNKNRFRHSKVNRGIHRHTDSREIA